MGILQKIRSTKRNSSIVYEEDFLYAPINGKYIPLEEMNDEVFRLFILGNGCGIIPIDETVYSPVEGVVTMIANTKHAIGITSENGIEVLIHVGLDTVKLHGKGFKTFVKVGQKVALGEKLLSFCMIEIKNHGLDNTIGLTVLNTKTYESVLLIKTGNIDIMNKVIKVNR